MIKQPYDAYHDKDYQRAAKEHAAMVLATEAVPLDQLLTKIEYLIARAFLTGAQASENRKEGLRL